MESTQQIKVKSQDWKFCAIVDLEINNLNEEIIHFEEHAIRIFKPNEKRLRGYFIAEVYSQLSNYPDLETAFYNSLEILNKVLTRLSFVTFRTCKIINPISISQYKAEKGEPFEMLITADVTENQPDVDIDLSKFPDLFTMFKETEVNVGLSEITLAIQSESYYSKFLHYYNSIERIADYLTDEFVKHKCTSCGSINEIEVKATGNKMRELFISEGYKNKDFKKCRSIRSKLAHGSTERTNKLLNDIFGNIGIVEKIAFSLLTKHTKIKVLDGGAIHRLRNQFLKIEGVKLRDRNWLTNTAYRIINHSFSMNVSINSVGEWKDNKERFITEHIPLDLNPFTAKIFPYAWPY